MNHKLKLIPLSLAWLIFMTCSPNPDLAGKKEVIFWHSFVAASHNALVELVKDFEAENQDIRIKPQYVPTGDALVQKLVTAIQSNTTPDIAWIHSDFMEKLVRADALHDLSIFYNGEHGITDEELGELFPVLLQEGQWKGVQYALPMEATSLALMVNRDLFRKAGLDPDRPPMSWDELRDYSIRLTEDTNQDGKIDVWGFYVPSFPASGSLSTWMVLQFLPFLWQAGGEMIEEDQSRVLFNSEAGVHALQLWKTIYDSLEMNTFSLAHDMAFMSQRVAMVLDGPWNLPNYRKIENFDWAVAPLPAGAAGSLTYFAGEKLVVFKESNVSEESWRFLRWMIKPQVQSRFSILSGYLPVNQKTLELQEYKEFLNNDPAINVFIDQLQFSRGRRPIDHYQVEINQILAESIEKVLSGDVDVQKALDEAAKECNALMSRKN